MDERVGAFEIKGTQLTIIGPDIQIGELAPAFSAQDQDWNVIYPLQVTAGKVRIIAALPSLETSVCDRETRRFNEEAAKLSEDIAVITISTDLPYTQKRWCGAAGIDQVMVVSDHLNADFGEKYGVLLKERRIFRRSVFVVDRENTVIYTAYMPILEQEPDYEAVLQVASSALDKSPRA
jgi:thioredoxin-dependent peroxiredoxin